MILWILRYSPAHGCGISLLLSLQIYASKFPKTSLFASNILLILLRLALLLSSVEPSVVRTLRSSSLFKEEINPHQSVYRPPPVPPLGLGFVSGFVLLAFPMSIVGRISAVSRRGLSDSFCRQDGLVSSC
ncbi:hypothetical protein B0H11DRAFT_2038625 [Mycena galericulata]|nr:hypothetical protein B0H11DRAFT_2038625 [Mycena galericulata]